MRRGTGLTIALVGTLLPLLVGWTFSLIHMPMCRSFLVTYECDFCTRWVIRPVGTSIMIFGSAILAGSNACHREEKSLPRAAGCSDNVACSG